MVRRGQRRSVVRPLGQVPRCHRPPRSAPPGKRVRRSRRSAERPRASSRPPPTPSRTAKVGTFNCGAQSHRSRLTLNGSFTFSFRELCAAILLACLFCRPLDCLLATVRGCNSWICSLCASACGCESSSLQPLVEVSRRCDPCGCAGPHCCSLCDICRQTTECLDFAMEMSQMLYH